MLLWYPPRLHCFCLPYIVHDDDDEEINILTYLPTYVRQHFVTCYVHTIHNTTLCVMPVDTTVSAVQ